MVYTKSPIEPTPLFGARANNPIVVGSTYWSLEAAEPFVLRINVGYLLNPRSV